MNEYRFRVLGFKVFVNSDFFIMSGILALFELQASGDMFQALCFVGVIFISILVHELGHALLARGFGLTVGRIRLHSFGGDVTYRRGSTGKNLLIALAGPFAGLLLGISTLALGDPGAPGIINTVLWDMARINITWSLFNLLPLLPLDGGQVLGSLLSLFSPKYAWPATYLIGSIVALVFVGFGIMAQQVFLMCVGGLFAYTNIRALQQWRGGGGAMNALGR